MRKRARLCVCVMWLHMCSMFVCRDYPMHRKRNHENPRVIPTSNRSFSNQHLPIWRALKSVSETKEFKGRKDSSVVYDTTTEDLRGIYGGFSGTVVDP